MSDEPEIVDLCVDDGGVRNRHERAFVGSNVSASKPDAFDTPRYACDAHAIPDMERTIHEDRDRCEHVGERRLECECDRQTAQPESGEEARDVVAGILKDENRDDHEDGRLECSRKSREKLIVQPGLGLCDPGSQEGDEHVDELDQDERHGRGKKREKQARSDTGDRLGQCEIAQPDTSCDSELHKTQRIAHKPADRLVEFGLLFAESEEPPRLQKLDKDTVSRVGPDERGD